jgi:hypothetical protein
VGCYPDTEAQHGLGGSWNMTVSAAGSDSILSQLIYICRKTKRVARLPVSSSRILYVNRGISTAKSQIVILLKSSQCAFCTSKTTAFLSVSSYLASISVIEGPPPWPLLGLLYVLPAQPSVCETFTRSLRFWVSNHLARIGSV